MIKYKGKKYSTKRELAEDLGISYDAMLMRQSRGMSLAKAVDFKPKSSFTYKKKLYKSYAEFIKELKLGLTVNQLKYRVKKTGSIAKAVKVPPHSYEVVYKRKKYRSLRALCDELGLVYSTIKNRVNAGGLSLADAIEASKKVAKKKPAVRKAATAKKAATKKKAAAKKAVAKKKTPAKKAPAKKAPAKKAVAKKKAAPKKAAAKKTPAKKAPAKKAVAKKAVAKKAPAKKAAPKKAAVKKAPAKRATARKTAKKK